MSSSNSILLNLVNRSIDRSQSKILIFQRNVASDLRELAVAWRVIQNLGLDWNHPFAFSRQLQVNVRDSYGNHSSLMETEEGMGWSAIATDSGDQLQCLGPLSGTVSELHVTNGLPQGAINANVYRDGKLVAIQRDIVPGQIGVFRFKPVLSFAVVSQVTEGQVVDSAIISSVNTELNLVGIVSADIVLTGGGAGKSAMPFRFTLQNIRTSQLAGE